MGASLQQVQPIAIRDLKGTPVYDRLLGAWKAKLPVPRLYVKLSKDIEEQALPDEWANEFDDTIVHVEGHCLLESINEAGREKLQRYGERSPGS
jgi:hypothetical protein